MRYVLTTCSYRLASADHILVTSPAVNLAFSLLGTRDSVFQVASDKTMPSSTRQGLFVLQRRVVADWDIRALSTSSLTKKRLTSSE